MAEIDDELDYSGYAYRNFRQPSDDDNRRYYVNVRSGNNDTVQLRAIEPDEIDNVPYLPQHTVEYVHSNRGTQLPSADRNVDINTKPVKPKAKGKHPYRKRGIAIAVLTMVLCLAVGLLISDTLSDGYILDSAFAVLNGGHGKPQTYYAVEMTNFTDSQSAKVYSQEVRLMGGAGYVVKDELHRVLAEVFDNKSDANSVIGKLNASGYMARIYEIELKEMDYSLLPSSVRSVTKKVINQIVESFGAIHRVGREFASAKYDNSETITELKVIRNSLSAILIDYESNVDSDLEDSNVQKIRLQIGVMVSAVDNLCKSKAGDTELLSEIRYVNLMMLNTQRALCNELQKPVTKK